METAGARRWRNALGCLGMAVALMGMACGNDGDDEPTGAAEGRLAQTFDFSGANFTVGSKEFTEQLTLGHITRLALEAAGANVKDEIGLEGSNVARQALTSGRIDMYWEYTGTGWITHLGQEEPIADSRAQYEAVAAKDLEEHGIRWLEPAPFENTYALAVREEAVDDLGVRTLSELPGLLESDRGAATLCLGSEFSTRPDGLPGLESHYGFKLPPRNLTLVQDAVVYTQVDKGNPCNFGVVFTTDGRVDALGLSVLDDDKSFFPKFNPSLNVRETVYQSHPELGKLAAELASALDEDTMTRLNAEVDVDGNEPEDVARRWLRQADLIG